MPVPTDATVGTSVSGMQPVLQGVSDTNQQIAVPRGLGLPGDANGITGYLAALTASMGLVFNGLTFDRLRSASAANLAAKSGLGAQLVHVPGDWTMVQGPGAATLATSTKTAGGAGVRRIITGISASLTTGATAQAVVYFYLRDGASTVGTPLFALSIQIPANSTWLLNISGLNIVTSANTDFTVEFGAAPVAGALQSFTVMGHDAV